MRELLVGLFIDLDEAFLFEGEHVNFALVNVRPESVNFQFFPFQTFLQERIREKVIELFQRIDLKSERAVRSFPFSTTIDLLGTICPKV